MPAAVLRVGRHRVHDRPSELRSKWFWRPRQQGAIEIGSDADFVVVDLDREVTVSKEHLNTRAGWSLMEGKTYHGWPIMTMLRGQVIAEWADDAPGPRPVQSALGRYLPRQVRSDVSEVPDTHLVRSGPNARLAGVSAGQS